MLLVLFSRRPCVVYLYHVGGRGAAGFNGALSDLAVSAVFVCAALLLPGIAAFCVCPVLCRVSSDQAL